LWEIKNTDEYVTTEAKGNTPFASTLWRLSLSFYLYIISQGVAAIQIQYTIRLFFIAALLLASGSAHAGLQPIGDKNLDQICGRSGFSMAIKNTQIFEHIDRFTYTCPDVTKGTCDDAYLSLENIKAHSRTWGPALFNYDSGDVTRSGIITFDVSDCAVASVEDWIDGTADSEHKVMAGIGSTDWDQDIAYFIGDINFGDPNEGGIKDLGWADFGSFDLTSFKYFTAPHGDGIDMEHDFQLHIDTLTYGYQSSATSCKSLAFNNIHIGQTFGYGLGTDDPSDPTTWYTSTGTDIGEFKIGDIFGDASNFVNSNPATIDATDTSCNDTLPTKHANVKLYLPLQGSIRFEQADFGGVDFGPGAIDGINAHRLLIEFIP